MAYTVQARGIRKGFGGRTVLDGVDLDVEPGKIFALLGPNGAGKTTLIRILATLLRPDAGSATIAGRDLLTDPKGVRGVISLTGQYAAVDDVLTGRENLRMMARLLHLSRRVASRRGAELLAAFDLEDAADQHIEKRGHSLMFAVSIHFQKSCPVPFCSWSEYMTSTVPSVGKSYLLSWVVMPW